MGELISSKEEQEKNSFSKELINALYDMEFELGAAYRRTSEANSSQHLEVFEKVPEELKQLSKDYSEVMKEFEPRLLQLYIQFLEVKEKCIIFVD